MRIRSEEKSDHEAVHALNTAAFDTSAEAKLVDVLREQAHPLLSLVDEEEAEVVGHIQFSPVQLSGHPNLKVMGLAPMAVAPEFQRSGIGSALVRSGLEKCKALGFSAVVVLGHPRFYPRFGFAPSSRFEIDSKYAVPEEVFMVIELQPGAPDGRAGTITYHPAFASV